MTTYRIVPERSSVRFEGSTNLHSVHGEGHGLTGIVDAEVAGETRPPPCAGGADRVRGRTPAHELRALRAELHRRIGARRYPTITGEVHTVRAAGRGRYRVGGDVTFHGVTKAVDGDVSLAVGADGSLEIEGQREFDVRDYGIEPPRLLLLKASPEITIRVRMVAEPEQPGESVPRRRSPPRAATSR